MLESLVRCANILKIYEGAKGELKCNSYLPSECVGGLCIKMSPSQVVITAIGILFFQMKLCPI